MSRYRVRVQLLEWYEVAVDGGSFKDALAKAEELSPPAIRQRGKHLSTETGLAASTAIALIATSLPSETLADPADFHQAFRMPDDHDPFAGLLRPKVPSAPIRRRKPCTPISPGSMSGQRPLIEPEVLEMPAQPSTATLPPLKPSATHKWDPPDGRQLELQPGKTLIHWRCTACRRNFVHDLTAQEWFAAFPRILDFERLDGVSQRWLAEECSGQYQAADERARKTQVDPKTRPT
jgi:hypothetical protein